MHGPRGRNAEARRKEQGSKEKTAFRLSSSYSAVKPQAAKCISIVVVRKSDCGPGQSGVMQSQSMPRQPSDGRVLAELRLMAGDDDEPHKDVLFYTSELRTEWNPPAM